VRMIAEDFLPLIRDKMLDYPGAYEDHPWGDTVFKVGGKIFAGAGSKSLTVKSTVDRQQVLIQDPAIKVAAYVGKHGWVTIDLSDKTLEVALELADESYQAIVQSLPKSKKPKEA
jgi:predicted DNA-binding protein (MmcQ/YjbR family)